jgi:ATP-dependent RNA helicase RhlE
MNDTFDGLGIAPKLLEILDKQGFKTPTPIQQQSIPIAISGKDLMGIAQTGTGKTLAFGIPMLQRLVTTKGKGLVVLPTRELAVQVNEALQKLGRPLGLKTAVLIGGESMHRQIRDLRFQPHIIIATPGRLIDHLEQKTVKLDQVSVLVLDEADRMLDMGFAPQLRKIIVHLPKVRQTMLFSATMEPEIVKIAAAYLELPIRVEVAPQGSTASKVTQEIFFVHREDKPQLLQKLIADYKGSILVFVRTKFGAKKIAQTLKNMDVKAAEIHSNRSLNQRLEALNGFKLGKYRVLVATDIAARGIDVVGIELVVNYDLPENASDYVHRIGRTARAGHTGHAISLATPDQQRDVKDIERLIKQSLTVSPVKDLPKRDPSQNFKSPPRESRDSRGGRGDRESRPSNGRRFERPQSRTEQPRDGQPKKSFERPSGSDRPKTFTPKRKFMSNEERAKKMYWAKN